MYACIKDLPIRTIIGVKELCNVVLNSMLDDHELHARANFAGSQKSFDGQCLCYFYDRKTSLPLGTNVVDWHTKPAVVDGSKRCSNPTCKNTECSLRCKNCIGSLSTYYCSSNCQRAHWFEHKNDCRKIMSPDMFWRWFMTGKCSTIHTVICEMFDDILNKNGYDVTIILPDGSSRVIAKMKLSEQLLYSKNDFAEVVSVYDVPENVWRSQTAPRLSDYDVTCVDRLQHALCVDCTASHPSRCTDKSHIGTHQMVAILLEPIGSSEGSNNVVLLDVTAAQFGIGSNADLDRNSIVRIFSSEEELASCGFNYTRKSDFKSQDKPAHWNQFREIPDSILPTLNRMLETSKRLLNMQTKS